eukprot:5525170-Heterocapsa_arctica.AAC.1
MKATPRSRPSSSSTGSSSSRQAAAATFVSGAGVPTRTRIASTAAWPRALLEAGPWRKAAGPAGSAEAP